MASSITTAHYISDTNTSQINAELQNRPRLKFLNRCFKKPLFFNRCTSRFCFTCVVIFSILFFMAGMAVTPGAVHSWRGLSDDFYEAFPEKRSEGKKEMTIGIGLFVTGIILMMIGITGITCCYYIKRNSLSTISFSTAELTNTFAPNTVSALVEPPLMVGFISLPMNGDSYDTAEQIEFFQEIQTSSNHYPPVQRDFSGYPPAYPTTNQYPLAQAVAHQAVSPEMMADEPPPSYTEVMAQWRYTNAFAESGWV